MRRYESLQEYTVLVSHDGVLPHRSNVDRYQPIEASREEFSELAGQRGFVLKESVVSSTGSNQFRLTAPGDERDLYMWDIAEKGMCVAPGDMERFGKTFFRQTHEEK